jgi:HSP20 family molecular chaperone IbpA
MASTSYWNPFASRRPDGTPAVDVHRDDDTLVVRAPVPGVEPGEVDVEIHDGVLEMKIPLHPQPAPDPWGDTPRAEI